jgi:hypothetical protein
LHAHATVAAVPTSASRADVRSALSALTAEYAPGTLIDATGTCYDRSVAACATAAAPGHRCGADYCVETNSTIGAIAAGAADDGPANIDDVAGDEVGTAHAAVAAAAVTQNGQTAAKAPCAAAGATAAAAVESAAWGASAGVVAAEARTAGGAGAKACDLRPSGAAISPSRRDQAGQHGPGCQDRVERASIQWELGDASTSSNRDARGVLP